LGGFLACSTFSLGLGWNEEGRAFGVSDWAWCGLSYMLVAILVWCGVVGLVLFEWLRLYLCLCLRSLLRVLDS
jgi:hypothetical protein